MTGGRPRKRVRFASEASSHQICVRQDANTGKRPQGTFPYGPGLTVIPFLTVWILIIPFRFHDVWKFYQKATHYRIFMLRASACRGIGLSFKIYCGLHAIVVFSMLQGPYFLIHIPSCNNQTDLSLRCGELRNFQAWINGGWMLHIPLKFF